MRVSTALAATLFSVALAMVASAAAAEPHEPLLLPDEVFAENIECLRYEAAKYVESDIDSTLLAETIGLACSVGLETVIRADDPDAEMDFVNRRLAVFGAAALTQARATAKSTPPAAPNK